MSLSWIDIGIVASYLLLTLVVGFVLSKRASKNLESYFLGGNQIRWYFLGLSNASGMFDISGTMWTVTIAFVYGLKSAWIPWLWPVWNQIFVMVFLAIWMRRSKVMTGAQWITFRFGDGLGARLSHVIVVVFAVISVIGFIAYFVEGIGKFSATFFTWDLAVTIGGFTLTSPQAYALIIIGITTVYTLKGGMLQRGEYGGFTIPDHDGGLCCHRDHCLPICNPGAGSSSYTGGLGRSFFRMEPRPGLERHFSGFE